MACDDILNDDTILEVLPEKVVTEASPLVVLPFTIREGV